MYQELSERLTELQSQANTLLGGQLGAMQHGYVTAMQKNTATLLEWLNAKPDADTSPEDHLYYTAQDAQELLRSIVSNSSFLLDNPGIFVGESLDDDQQALVRSVRDSAHFLLLSMTAIVIHGQHRLNLLKPLDAQLFDLAPSVHALLNIKRLFENRLLLIEVDANLPAVLGDSQYTRWLLDSILPLLLLAVDTRPAHVQAYSTHLENDDHVVVVQFALPGVTDAYDEVIAVSAPDWQANVEQSGIWAVGLHLAAVLARQQGGDLFVEVDGDALLLIFTFPTST